MELSSIDSVVVVFLNNGVKFCRKKPGKRSPLAPTTKTIVVFKAPQHKTVMPMAVVPINYSAKWRLPTTPLI